MDILKRLTEFASVERRFENPIYYDAAEEISRLRAELKRINDMAIHLSSDGHDQNEKRFSKRDVEALVAITRAVEAKRNPQDPTQR